MLNHKKQPTFGQGVHCYFHLRKISISNITTKSIHSDSAAKGDFLLPRLVVFQCVQHPFVGCDHFDILSERAASFGSTGSTSSSEIITGSHRGIEHSLIGRYERLGCRNRSRVLRRMATFLMFCFRSICDNILVRHTFRSRCC